MNTGSLLAAAVAAVLLTNGVVAQTQPTRQARTAAYNRDRNAYFGDLHVHTKLSFDAYIFNVRATPDDAYRYAKGESIHHASGYDVRLTDAPLDFLAVTDHSEYLGILPAMNDPQHPLSKIPYAPDLFSTDREKITAAFQQIATSLRTGRYLPELKDQQTMRSAWRTIIDSADRNYVPGKFTTFRGYEYTSAPDGQNLHRNVIFAGARSPDLPFTALESQNPEELWRWMDQQRAQGTEMLAIPHNSNGSDGRMFQRVQFDGRPMDRSYAELRLRNEPLAEISQVKGTSETHPALSPNDEWSSFEIMDTYIGSATKVTKFAGGYVRDALKSGLEFEQSQGFNPYRFGFVGASDTHVAAGPSQENRYFGKVGLLDGKPEQRGSVPPAGQTWENYEPQNNCALSDLGQRRPDRRVGRREHARIGVRSLASQGNLRDVRPTHARALLRRLPIPRRARRSSRHGPAQLRAWRADGRRSAATWSACAAVSRMGAARSARRLAATRADRQRLDR